MYIWFYKCYSSFKITNISKLAGNTFNSYHFYKLPFLKIGNKINSDIKIHFIWWLEVYKLYKAFKYIIVLYYIKGKWEKWEVINEVKVFVCLYVWPFHYILSQFFVYMTVYQPNPGSREMVTMFCSSLNFQHLAKCLGHNTFLKIFNK